MRRRAALAVFCSVLTVSSSVWAAVVEPIVPTASIRYQGQSSGFQTISGRVQGNTGDSVMVGPGGLARITYNDGCRQEVKPGEVVTIQEDPSPCATGAFAQTPDWALWGVGIGFATATGIAICQAIQACGGSSSTRPAPLSP